MKQSFSNVLSTAAIALSVAPLFAGYGETFQIGDLVNRSDLIVVGPIQSGSVLPNGWLVNVSVERTLKGTATPGTLLPVRYELPAGTRIQPGVPSLRALWFLQKSASTGEWNLLPAETGLPSFESAVYEVKSSGPPASYPYADTDSNVDKVISEIAQATEDFDGGSNYGGRLPITLGSLTSPKMQSVYRRWLASPSVNIQVFGLLGLLSQNGPDADALLVLAAHADAFAKFGWLRLAVSEYRNMQRVDAIQALGKLATAGPDTFRSPAAEALGGIHNKATVPYLAVLLDSADPAIRQFAVAGLSGFALSMPVAKSGPATSEAIDSVLNPGRRPPAQPGQNQDIYQYMHFGPFSDSAQEASIIQYWKSWVAVH